MSRYSNYNGCVTTFTIIAILLFSIVSAFESQFIPIIIIISIALILWIENIFVKHKSERKKLAEIAEGRNTINLNNSKLYIVITIIVFGVIASMIFQTSKREYFENKNNEQIEYISTNIQSNNFIDTTEYKATIIETVWLNESLEYCFYKLPQNFILQEEMSNQNIKFYLDSNSNLSFNISFRTIPNGAEYKSIDEISQNITSFANSINDNNKLNFDDFKLINYKTEKLDNLQTIKIEQTSSKISGKNIEMLITNYNVISGISFYNITYAYPKDNYTFKKDFEKIKSSIIFKNMEDSSDNVKDVLSIELGNYKVIENVNVNVYFYDKPDDLYKRKGYLISGEIINVEQIENNFGYINFTNFRGINSKGWIKMEFLEKS